MKQYKHIIWDWNGTLLDDVWLCLLSINELLKARNLQPQSLENYRAIFDFPVRDYYERIGFDLTRESFEEVGAAFMNYYEARRDECRLHKGVVEQLVLCDQFCTQSVLSAYRQEDLQDALDRYGISKYFAHVCGHYDIYASGKLESGKALVEKLDMPAQEILLIGDTTHDYDVAAAMGIDCVLIVSGHHRRDKLQTRPVPVYDSLEELIDL